MEAVAAHRAALEERTRERVPLDWARTQNNLGAALETLGGRESGTAKLEEAVAAHRDAGAKVRVCAADSSPVPPARFAEWSWDRCCSRSLSAATWRSSAVLR